MINRALFLAVSILTLTACAPFKPTNSHAGMCNELNSQIIFNGATSNDRQAEIEGSELPLQQRTYDQDTCEK